MSNRDKPDRKGDLPSLSPQFPGAGRSARPAAIGEELGGDLDFEPDALLESLLSDASAPAVVPLDPHHGDAAKGADPVVNAAQTGEPTTPAPEGDATPAVQPHGPRAPRLPQPPAPRRAGPPRPQPPARPLPPPRPNPDPTAVEPASRRETPLPSLDEEELIELGPDEAIDPGSVVATEEETTGRFAARHQPPEEAGSELEPLLEGEDDIETLLPPEPPASPDPHAEFGLAALLEPGEEAEATPSPAHEAGAPTGSTAGSDRSEPAAGEDLAPPAPRGPHDTEVDEDPNDGLESLPPEAFAAAGAASQAAAATRSGSWDAERPAATHLSESDQLAAFSRRASGFEAEAAATDDTAVRARYLLIASELWAMCGDVERARDAAELAVKTAPGTPLASRQVRWLAALGGDLRSVSSALEIESRASASAAARVHAAYLNAEVRRHAFGDMEGAQQRADLATRLDPTDPRPHLLRLLGVLGESSTPPRLTLTDDPRLGTLRSAIHQLIRRRGQAGSPDEIPAPAVAFEDARRALAHGDLAAAANALSRLSQVEGLERGALWLGASLLAHRTETRSQAIRWLSSLLRREPTPAVRRALLARALEQGDAVALETAIAPSEGGEAFTVAERVAIGALTGADAATLQPWLEAIRDLPALAPLAAAASSLATAPGAVPAITIGDPTEQSALSLGRALGADDVEALTEAHDAFLAEHGEAALARLLGVELALLARDAPSLATQVAAWPLPDETGSGDRDRQIVASLILLAAGQGDEARAAIEAALSADPSSEMLTRALASGEEPEDAAGRLVSLADRSADESTQALLLLEAALRCGSTDSTYEALLRRAAETQPDLPFAAHLGELAARRRGDVEGVVEWLRLRRLAATDATERALDAAREALLVADTAPESARRLLEEAIAVRPSDAGLHELLERLAPAPSPEQGRWREALATTDEAAAPPLLAVACLEYERDGANEDAFRVALAAAEHGSTLCGAIADRLAASVEGGSTLVERWREAARTANTLEQRRQTLSRLLSLGETREDRAEILHQSRALLADAPTDLEQLRRLAHHLLATDDGVELESIAAQLGGLLDRAEGTAHAQLATRLRARSGRWDECRELVALAYRHGEPDLWTLRQLSAHARVAGDDDAQLVVDQQLLERAGRAIDAATLALRAGETATRLGRLDEARELLARTVELLPEHFVGLTTYAEILESLRAYAQAADALEALAQASQVDAHRLEAWYQAAMLWQEQVVDVERARAALEQVVQLDPTHEDASRRLQALYVESGDRAALAELLERRLARTTDPEQRVRLEVTRGRALAEIGDRAAAKSALAAALDANPDHVDALDAYAELCLADADWTGAEQAWIRLVRHASEPERQAAIYRRLGTLYEGELPNSQRAELAYLEVLKRQPNDVAATRRLVEVYGQLGQPERSVELTTELVNRAGSPEEKRDRTLELARVYETILGDPKQVEATLDRARKAWPHDGRVLRAVADYYQRRGETRSLQVLLERSANDARRALHTGRFDPAFFDVLATVAEIRGGADAAQTAKATVAALAGEEVTVDGAGPAAGSPELDDLLAPDTITLPLRALLRRAGAALDRAFCFDLRAVRAAPLPVEMGGYVNHVGQVAEAFGLSPVEVFASGSLGAVCVPTASPSTGIVFGQALLDSTDDATRFFLLLRSLKILQANAAPLSRVAPIDLWPMVAAFLQVLCPTWTPTGVDTRRLEEHHSRLVAVLPREPDPELSALALEVASSIGSRASQLGTAIHQWGNRVALLALGDLNAAMRAIALTQGNASLPPPAGVERMKWITRNPEARDLAVFSVSEAYAEARQRLGLE